MPPMTRERRRLVARLADAEAAFAAYRRSGVKLDRARVHELAADVVAAARELREHKPRRRRPRPATS